MIPVPIAAIIGAVLAALLAIGGASWYAYDKGAEHQLLSDNAAVAQQKIDAANDLINANNKAQAASDKLAKLTHDTEVKSELDSHAIDDLSGRLRLAAVNGRLRDPNAGRGSCSSGPAGANPGPARDRGSDGAEAGGLLSADLSGLLQRQAVEADRVNIAYSACRTERWGLSDWQHKADEAAAVK